MTYFDCFMVGSWMSVLGWFLSAIYAQNQNNEETESRRRSEQPERESEVWQVPPVASAAAD